MSSRSRSELSLVEREELQVGDVVRQHLGLHRSEPHVMWRVTKITAINVYLLGITRGRGSKNRSRIFKVTRAHAGTVLSRVSRAQPAAAA